MFGRRAKAASFMILHRLFKSHLLRAGMADETRPPDPSVWRALLDLVNHHYELGDADRHRLARATDEIRALYADLANERYKLHSVVTSLPMGLGALDREGRLLFLNPEGERLLGYSEEELRRQSPLELVEPSLNLTLEELVGSGQAWTSHDHGMRSRDGFLAAVLHVNPMVRDGKLLGAILVFDPGEEQGSRRYDLEPLKPHLSGLVNSLTSLARGSLPDGLRELVEAACGYANLLAVGMEGQAVVTGEATLELAGLRMLVVGAGSATLLGSRRQMMEWGVCTAEAPEVDRALAMLSEASQRDRAFDAVLVDGTPGWADRLSVSGVRVISVADLPRPVHPGDLLAALRHAPGSFKTDVYEAVRENAMRVCVVDFEGTAVLEEVVTDLNFEFLLAGDGHEAWDMLQEEPVDVIVGEWKACEELVKRVRDEERSVTLVVLTTADKEAKRARKLGADATLGAPVEREAVTRLLRKLAREGARKALVADV